MSARVRGRQVAVTIAVLAVAHGWLLTGCDDVHASRRAAATDICAPALPPAQAAAGPDTALIAVRRISLPQAEAMFGRSLGAQAGPQDSSSDAGADPDSRLCVLAYRTHDSAGGSGRTPAARGSAPVVLVLTTTRHPRVLSTLDAPSLPQLLR